MGVPGFFAWLLKKYKSNNIITNNIADVIDILYIDANCLFHPQCHKVLNYYIEKGKHIELDKLESKMIARILNYIDYIIGFSNPQKAVFISVDGVAPCAKISQQRKRRYKAIYDNEIRNELKKKHNKSNSDIWNNTTITPGTKFMEKLHQHILQHIKENKLNLNIDYVYSSYHTMGEGEHKILQDIKERSKNLANKQEVYCIYGLDADLIFLAMASNKEKIYLLREETFLKNGIENTEKDEIIDILTDVAENLNYVSIDETKECINNQFRSLIYDAVRDDYNNDYQNVEFVKDFIVLCYFLGNDFIPNIPSIDIRNDGLDCLLNLYIDTYLSLNTGITDESSNINIIFLEMYLESMSKHEDYYFKVKYPKYMEYIKRRKCLSDDLYEKELWDIENTKIFESSDPIRLGHGDPEIWKFRYYEHYYGVIQSQKEHINKMCEEFIRGLKWNSLYYFDKCPSWNWYYNYSHAPFASDIFNFIKTLNGYDIDKITFDNSITLSPFIQLLSVLPPKCSDLLPVKYGNLMISKTSPIIDMFPEIIKIDTLYKDSYHKCIPMISNINIKRIMNTVANIVLTAEEKNRNTILNNYHFCYRKNLAPLNDLRS
jgi:5'-3' exonuclease